MHYTYILTDKEGDFMYIGSTSNLKERLDDHNAGNVESTKHFIPLSVEWYAGFSSKEKALNFEKYLKSSSGHAFRNKRLI